MRGLARISTLLLLLVSPVVAGTIQQNFRLSGVT
jgi:hypothetical protein